MLTVVPTINSVGYIGDTIKLISFTAVIGNTDYPTVNTTVGQQVEVDLPRGTNLVDYIVTLYQNNPDFTTPAMRSLQFEHFRSTLTIEVPEVPELTLEELRQQMVQLSMVEFRKKLRNVKVIQRYNEAGNPIGGPDGIYEEDILGVIGLIADKELQAEARDYFLYAQYISRANVWVDILGGMFGLTPQQIDILWMSDVNSENIEFI